MGRWLVITGQIILVTVLFFWGLGFFDLSNTPTRVELIVDEKGIRNRYRRSGVLFVMGCLFLVLSGAAAAHFWWR
jgi:hypothetical protein